TLAALERERKTVDHGSTAVDLAQFMHAQHYVGDVRLLRVRCCDGDGAHGGKKYKARTERALKLTLARRGSARRFRGSFLGLRFRTIQQFDQSQRRVVAHAEPSFEDAQITARAR